MKESKVITYPSGA